MESASPHESKPLSQPRITALEGALVADALAMPVHWYYDRLALRRDYGSIDRFRAPKNPHPDSILWRSRYEPLNPEADILHDQAGYWGLPGIHYHQNLAAGENTLNFKLARLLYTQTHAAGQYDADAWLELYVDVMRMRGWHRDTYVEEYHRNFFTQRARGKKLRACGGEDNHIGGLAPVPALFAALPTNGDALVEIVLNHVGLTHRCQEVLNAAAALCRMLLDVESGIPLRQAILRRGSDWVQERKFLRWSTEPDAVVIGEQLSSACYIQDAFPAALYLSWKYASDFETGIIANAHVGGDNCHRGAVIGSLLAMQNGIRPHWLQQLKVRPQENHVDFHHRTNSEPSTNPSRARAT
jgi:ADP-ribosyl-[dinitrogen reductase] hydrolase